MTDDADFNRTLLRERFQRPRTPVWVATDPLPFVGDDTDSPAGIRDQARVCRELLTPDPEDLVAQRRKTLLADVKSWLAENRGWHR